jgi:hypothetical protein
MNEECFVDLDNPDESQGGVNAGVMVFRPNKTVYTELLKLFNNGEEWHYAGINGSP